MAEDDKKFEGVLAGFLHREKRDSEGHVFCPEPELLAAYHERTLSPEEIQVARLHVEGCSRCQEVLAQLKKTDELPLLASTAPKPESVPVQPLTFPGSATPVTNRSRWLWIAPGGAIAAGLVMWLAFHQARSTKLPSPSESAQVAETRNEPDKTSDYIQPPVTPSQPAPQELAREMESKPSNKIDKLASPGPSAGIDLETREAEARRASPSAPPLRDSASNSRAIHEFSNNSARATKGKAVAAPAASAGKVEGMVTAQSANAALVQKKISSQFSATKNPVIIGTAGTAVWRVGPAGSIEISVDGGNTWHAQISGVSADLSAGSAPLAGVCWVVGRAGTILLTTDSGASWRTIKSPTEKDIAGVLALDAANAKIWNASNEKFETVDGGVTWNRVASE
jgi:hypothetical protein